MRRPWQLSLPSRLEQQLASRRRQSAGVQQRQSGWRSWQTSSGESRKHRWVAPLLWVKGVRWIGCLNAGWRERKRHAQAQLVFTILLLTHYVLLVSAAISR